MLRRNRVPEIIICALVLTCCKSDPTCHLESSYHYDDHNMGRYNTTSLRVCTPQDRDEAICIVGSGLSAVHLGWLLRRRGLFDVTLLSHSTIDRI
jgi:hypothetical protein